MKLVFVVFTLISVSPFPDARRHCRWEKKSKKAVMLLYLKLKITFN